MEPLVSIIMPVYNAEKYISIAIESIICQTYSNWELLLIDDCGIDNSMEIADKYIKSDERIKLFQNEKNMGIAYSRNKGLDASRGKYVAIMDDDEYAFSSRLEKQVKFLEENPTFDVVGGQVQTIDENGEIIESERKVLTDWLYIKTMFLFFNIYHNSEVIFRKDLVERAQLRYEDGLFGMEDFKFWVKASKYGKMSNLDDLVLQHRMTANNETNHIKFDHCKEREGVFAQIQRYSVEMSGFLLSEAQFRLLCKVMKEDGRGSAESSSELSMLYYIFRDMIIQARARELDITAAMENWFRDIFASKVALISADNMWD